MKEFEDLTDAQVHTIVAGNAARVFGFDLSTLPRPAAAAALSQQ